MGRLARDQVIVGGKILPRPQATMSDAQANRGIVSGHLTDPARGVVEAGLAEDGAWKQRRFRVNRHRSGVAQHLDALRLRLVPRRAVPYRAGKQRVMIAGKDEDATRKRLEQIKGPAGQIGINGVIVK